MRKEGNNPVLYGTYVVMTEFFPLYLSRHVHYVKTLDTGQATGDSKKLWAFVMYQFEKSCRFDGSKVTS